MNLAFSRIKQIIPSFNERVVSPTDLLRIFHERGIQYAELELNQNGYYVLHNGIDYVFIKERIKDLLYHQILCHEGVHALIHFPASFLLRKQQKEAEALALIAMIPITDLNYWLSIAGSLEKDEYELVERRLGIYKNYGL